MKLESGDDIERSEVNWIRTHLPEYEHIWSMYIGHDGHGSPLKIVGFAKPSPQDMDREAFYQAHYTLFVSLITLRDIIAAIDGQQAYVPDSHAYLMIQRELISFLANVGRARDMFKKMDTALGLKGTVWSQFQDLYQNRCSFLHGTLPSQQIDGGILKIPDLAGTNKTPEKWNDESRWSDSSKLKFDVAPAQLNAIYRDLLSLSRSGLSVSLTRIKEILAKHNAHIEPDPIIANSINAPVGSTLNMTLSGICFSANSG
jgi:hypothetical protein